MYFVTFEIVKNVKSLGSLPRNWYFNVFSLEVKCEVLAKRINLLLYLFRIYFASFSHCQKCQMPWQA